MLIPQVTEPTMLGLMRAEQRPAGVRPRANGVALLAVAALYACALVLGAGYAVLYLFNPVGDEWICSEGEAPARNDCYRVGSKLPPGVSWHRFGNRPMPYNCDKDGWVLIERTVRSRGSTDTIQDCVREGTVLPGRWRLAEVD